MALPAQRARRFFERELPALIGENRAVFGALRGTVGFVVHEVGDWTLRFGALDAALVQETRFDTDLTLMFSASSFAALLDGVAPVPGRGFAMAGEAKLLHHLSRVLGPGAGGTLAARAAAF